MRQVNWNRTRWLLAFAILSSVIGFGGYAASTAQEPTPAKEGKTPCQSCGEKKAAAGNAEKASVEDVSYKLCPLYWFASTVIDPNTTPPTVAYYHYAIRYQVNGEVCTFDGLSMDVRLDPLDAPGLCTDQSCAGASYKYRDTSGRYCKNVKLKGRLRDNAIVIRKSSANKPLAQTIGRFVVNVPRDGIGEASPVLVTLLAVDPKINLPATRRASKLLAIAYELEGDIPNDVPVIRECEVVSTDDSVMRLRIGALEVDALIAPVE